MGQDEVRAWLQLIAAAVVAPLAAWLAARHGVVLGSRLASREQRRAREEQDGRMLHALLRRFALDVERVQAIPEEMEDAHASDLMPTLADHLDEMSKGFFAGRGAVLLVGDRRLERGMERFYLRLLTLRGWLVAWHDEEMLMGRGGALPEKITQPKALAGFARETAEGGQRALVELRSRFQTYDL